jgi:hypothetical protein
VAGSPQIAFTAPQSGQIAENTLAFLPVGLALDPSTNRIAVLARRQFHGNQDVGL